MNIEDCKKGMMVYVTGANDSVNRLGGGDTMKNMAGRTCEIIELSSSRRSVIIRDTRYGDWYFLPSDLRPVEDDIEVEPNIFHFNETTL